MAVPPAAAALVRAKLLFLASLGLHDRFPALRAEMGASHIRMPAQIRLHGIYGQPQRSGYHSCAFALQSHIANGNHVLFFHTDTSSTYGDLSAALRGYHRQKNRPVGYASIAQPTGNPTLPLFT